MLDVKLSGGDLARLCQADERASTRHGDTAGEARKFVAFNLQLRTLRYGWKDAMGEGPPPHLHAPHVDTDALPRAPALATREYGSSSVPHRREPHARRVCARALPLTCVCARGAGVDQLVSVEIQGPGASALSTRTSTRSARHTTRTRRAPKACGASSLLDRASRHVPSLSRDGSHGSRASGRSSREGGSREGERSPSLAVLQLSLGRSMGRILDGAKQVRSPAFYGLPHPSARPSLTFSDLLSPATRTLDVAKQRNTRYKSVDDDEGAGPSDRNMLVLTFRQVLAISPLPTPLPCPSMAV